MNLLLKDSSRACRSDEERLGIQPLLPVRKTLWDRFRDKVQLLPEHLVGALQTSIIELDHAYTSSTNAVRAADQALKLTRTSAGVVGEQLALLRESDKGLYRDARKVLLDEMIADWYDSRREDFMIMKKRSLDVLVRSERARLSHNLSSATSSESTCPASARVA